LPADAQHLIPESERNMTAAQLQSSKDTQLLKAIASLNTASVSTALAPAVRP
jgi:hypothetical protein